MKKILIYISLIAVFTLTSITSLNAQPPKPGQQPDNGDVNGSRLGGNGAPVGNGTLILIVLAVAYAGRKTYTLRQQIEEVE